MISDEVRSWIGTPYKHQHSTKGAGCDCLGLLRGVYRAVIGPEPESPPPYSPSWGETGKIEYLLDAANRWLVPCAVEDAEVLVFRMRVGRMAKHCGIVVAPDVMVHADSALGIVAECHLTPQWKSKIAGAFKWPTS